ncbi:hypothetical protein [Streptomyces sp. A244]|uniref:hypothetical protein n=1 Tax=Streptomyces sp. A244 TaxID=2137016 RepID=UPI0015E784CD|nr:hypothetical protein [Streptomyces sp. A244]
MARSTIQDKLSGKSAVNLPEVLSIVEALAEHARLSGAPLPSQEIEVSVWRERVSASSKTPSKAQAKSQASPITTSQHKPWNVEALELAQMHDLIEIVQNSDGAPTSYWLPQVVAPMLLAGMSVVEFIKRAAEDDPQEVVQTLAALDRSFPAPEDNPWESRNPWLVSDNDRTVGSLLTHTARRHGARATPAIIVAMRRTEIGEHVDEYLVSIARLHPARNIQHIVGQLRAATLASDADKLLRFTGSRRQTDRVLEVVLAFRARGMEADAKRILLGVGAGGWLTIKNFSDEVQGHEAAEEFVREILRGIPYGEHSEFAEQLKKYGDEPLAQRILSIADEPPF